MRASSCIVSSVLVLTCATATTLAYAQPAAVAPQPKRRAVSVEIRGTCSDSGILSATILEILARLGLTMVESRTGVSSGELLVSVEIALGEAAARITAVSVSGATVVDRTLNDPSAEIRREQIAEAVLGAAEAQLLAEEDRVPDRRAQASAPSPVVAPPAPASSTLPAEETPAKPLASLRAENDASFGRNLALDVSTMLGAGPTASTAGVIMRVGAGATLAYRRGLNPSLTLSGLYAFPFEADDHGTRAKLSSMRLIGSLQPIRGTWFALDIGVGGGLDVFSFASLSTSVEPPKLLSQLSVLDPVLTGATVARFPIASNVVLNLSAVVDVSLSARQRPPEGGGIGPDDTFSPWAVRPMLLAGFSFTTFGGSPFSSPVRRSPSVRAARAE